MRTHPLNVRLGDHLHASLRRFAADLYDGDVSEAVRGLLRQRLRADGYLGPQQPQPPSPRPPRVMTR